MFILLTKNIIRDFRTNAKTIKQYGIILNSTSSLASLSPKSEVIVLYESSIDLMLLIDLGNALGLDIKLVVNNNKDYDMCKDLFKTVLVRWDYIDGRLISALAVDDKKSIELLEMSSEATPKKSKYEILLNDARKLSVMNSSSDAVRNVASAYYNLVTADKLKELEVEDLRQQLHVKATENISIKKSLSRMSSEVSDMLKAFSTMQTQMASREVVDVIKENKNLQLPSNITSIVIKNFGLPNLMKLVDAVMDSLSTSHNIYCKLIYIAEADSISINEIDKKDLLLINSKTKASDLLINDKFLCVGSVNEPIEFLLSSSSIGALIIVDSRRTVTELITGQTMSLYTAMDYTSALNLNLNEDLTITSSKKSKYFIREEDFEDKAKHALRNNKLVTKIINTLVSSNL